MIKLLFKNLFLLTLVSFGFMNFVLGAKYPEFCSAVNGSLQKGDIGEGVRQLQIVLNKELSGDLVPTGTYGPLTLGVVKKFQRIAGIYPVGKVGPQTYSRMRSLWCQEDYNESSNGGQEVTISPISSVGAKVTIGWNTKNSQTCSLDNEYIDLNGTKVVEVYFEKEFKIVCYDTAGKKVEKTITVKPNQNVIRSPEVKVTIYPTSGSVGSTATINWTSTGSDYCTFNGQNVPLNGSKDIVVQSMSTTYLVACSANGYTSSASVSTSGN